MNYLFRFGKDNAFSVFPLQRNAVTAIGYDHTLRSAYPTTNAARECRRSVHGRLSVNKASHLFLRTVHEELVN
jgi:hypothetical protein